MPRRNTRLSDRSEIQFHAYNRERDRAPMFLGDDDRRYFKSLFARYLAADPQFDSRGREYPNFSEKVRVEGLTLKTNHFHAPVFQVVPYAAGELMHAVMTSYVGRFNKRHGRGGAMFDSEVKFRPSETRRDELNTIAYAHENHGDHCYCEFCTHSLYVGHPSHVPEWLDVAGGLARFGGVDGYLEWMRARRAMREVLARRKLG